MKDEQLKKFISSNNLLAEKQEEIKRLEMKIKEISCLNNSYINEIDVLKTQLLNKDQLLNVEMFNNCSLINELSLLQNQVAELRSVPCAIKILADEGYFTLKKNDIEELDQLLEYIHNTVEELQQENENIKDENNNLKCITNDFTSQLNNTKRENNELKSQLNLIVINIKSIINEFSFKYEIDVDNSEISTLLNFAAKQFKQNTDLNEKLISENVILKEKLSLSNNNLCKIKYFVFDNLDSILTIISSMQSSSEIENLNKDLSESLKENKFLKYSIRMFDELTFECGEIIEQIKCNQSNTIYLQEELTVCNAVKNEFEVQCEQLNKLNVTLKTFIENQKTTEKEIQEKFDLKCIELKDVLKKLNEISLIVGDYEIKTKSNDRITNQLNIELQNVKSNLEEKSNLLIELENSKTEWLSKYIKLENCYQSNVENIKHKEEIEKQLRVELVTKTNDLQNAIDELKEMKTKVQLNMSEIDKLNTLLDSINSELDIKSNLIIKMENNKLELEEKQNDLELVNQLNNINSELKNKLEEMTVSENTTREELLTKKKELEDIQIKDNTNLTIIGNLNNELNTNRFILEEKSKLVEKLEVTMSSYVKEINELNKIVIKLNMELEEKSIKEKDLKNELYIVTTEIEDAIVKTNEVKVVFDILKKNYESKLLIVEQLNNELDCIKSTFNEKNSLIVELENTNSELLTKCENLKIIDQLNKYIVELKFIIDTKGQIENEMRNELQAKNIQLENALIKENNTQALVESMENDIKSNNILIKQFESELSIKSNLLTKLENTNSELLLKCSELNETKLSNLNENKQIQDKLQTVIHEKALIKNNHIKIKAHLEDTLQQQALNYQKLNEEFVHFASDIELFLKLHIDTESKLRTELDDLQRQLYESSLQQDYEKLEEEYIQRSHECDEAFEKIKNLESILLTKEESEKVLKNNFKSKCVALEEYKKNVEYLFMRNDSFQGRVNDFEDNVLVDLNEEFDSMKSELTKKNEYEKILLEEKQKLECNLKKLQEKLVSTSKALELSKEQSDDLASIINVLVTEIKEANSVKENLESRCNQAEHELLKSGDYIESIEYELKNLQIKLEYECVKSKCVEKEFLDLELKCNDEINKKDLDGLDDRNQIIDSLIEYVHEIKLKLTELNSAMISGNQSEKELRIKVMSVEDDILPLDETWKLSCNPKLKSTDIEIGLEIDNLRKVLKNKTNLVQYLQNAKNDMEININELQEQINKQSVENNKLVNDMALMDNDLKEKTLTINNLNNDLNNIKIQYKELEEHNQATKQQIHYSFDIDSELRNGKKNLVNEINLLEPGKITGIVTHHNLSNLLVMFVNLIMTKEQQIVADLVHDHNKIKQQYEEQIRQFEEDIKKGKEWQEQVESDNEKLSFELEKLKSEKHNFPSREFEINELTEKVLEAENQSFNYLCELQELKNQFCMSDEVNNKLLSDEFELFKTNSDQSIQSLNNKLEDLTHKYNESLCMYKDQKNINSTLEGQIEKVKSECTCLKAVIEKKDEDIKNLFEKIQLKTLEYEALIQKNSLQKDEMKEIHEKKIDELQLELNDKIQQIYRTEKLLKEVTRSNKQLIEERSLNLLQIKQQENHNSDASVKVAELEHDIQRVTVINKNIESLESELKLKSAKLEETKLQCSKLVQELELYMLKVIEFERQLENYQQSLKIKDAQIENYQIKINLNDNDLININNVTENLRKLLKCTGTLPIIYDHISSLMTKFESLEEEIIELKHINVNLDNECEAMLIEIKNKDDKIIEFLTQEDEMRQTIELLTKEKDILKNKCDQLKNVNDNVKKLNDEMCSYEQNIYQLRKEKGQLIVEHDKKVNELKTELKETYTKKLEIQYEYNKLSGKFN